MACAGLWFTLRHRCGAAVATVVLASFVGLSDVLFAWRTTTHSLSLAYILAGACLFAAALKRQWSAAGLIIAAAALGSGFNFIDFLINPPMMPMLLSFFVLLEKREDAGLLALAAAIAWFGGYAETWLGNGSSPISPCRARPASPQTCFRRSRCARSARSTASISIHWRRPSAPICACWPASASSCPSSSRSASPAMLRPSRASNGGGRCS